MDKFIKKFDDLFEPQIRERGIGYYYNDLVKNIKYDNNTYSATISGTRNYDVKIKFNDKEDKILEAHCNCPYSIDREKYCKHIYALLYALKGEKLDNRPINNKKYNYSSNTGEVVNVKCPNCGSNLRIISPAENIECNYCHSSFALDIRLLGLEKKLNEIIEQAELYYNAEDFKEAYYEFAKAYALNKEDKYIKYCMDLSGKLKNLGTNLSLNDYNNLYEDMKEVFNNPTTDEKKRKTMCTSFINLITRHANKHLNRFDLAGSYFWEELDTAIDIYIKMLKELDLSNELIIKVYKNYKEILDIEVNHYDTFSSYATNSKGALEKASQRIEREIEKRKKNL